MLGLKNKASANLSIPLIVYSIYIWPFNGTVFLKLGLIKPFSKIAIIFFKKFYFI